MKLSRAAQVVLAKVPRGRAAVSLAAAATAVALTGAGLAGCGAANRAAGRSERTPGRSSATRTGRPVPAPPYRWLRSDSAALGLGGGATSTLSDVLAPGVPTGGWLIVGTRTAADGTTTATLWTSPGAENWQATALPGVDGQAFAATRWGSHTIVVGSVGAGAAQHAAVWISPGRDQPFTAVPDQAAFAGRIATAGRSGPTGTARMTMVGAGTDGVYAVGAADGETAVWYSTNGMSWRQEPAAERLLDGEDATVNSLAVGGGPTLTGDLTHGTERVGAIWSSGDGISWHQQSSYQPFNGPGDDVLNDRIRLPGGVLAVGAVRDGPNWQPAAWLSPNGSMWGEPNEAIPTAAAPGGDVIRAAALSGGRIVAVGGSATTQEEWTSGAGGRLWKEMALPSPVATARNWSADLVATDGRTTVIVDSQPGQPHVLVEAAGRWDDVTAHPGPFGAPRTVVTPVGVAHLGSRLVLAADVDRPAAAIGGKSHSYAVALGSTDGGRTWSRLSTGPGWSDVRLQGLVSVGGRLVAVGDELSPSGVSDGVGMWTSSNGSKWLRTGSGTGADLDAAAVAAVDGRAVAVGSASEGSASGGSASGGSGATGAGSTGTVGTGSAGTVGAGGTGSGGAVGAVGWTAVGGWSGVKSLGGPPAGASRALGACGDSNRVVAVGQATRDSRPPTALAEPSTSASGGSGSGSTGASGGSGSGGNGNLGGGSSTSTTSTTEPNTGSQAGPLGQSNQGTLAVAWSSRNGSDWQPATVAPMTGVGAQTTMTGCVRTRSGWVAYGAAPAATGPAVPAVWTSPTGTAWTAVDAAGLSGTEAGPFTDLTTFGSTWTAVSGGLTPPLSTSANPAVVAGDPLSPTAPTTAATGPDGGAAVWQSADGGRSWARLDTSGSAWTAPGGQATADLVTGKGRDLLVVGQVGGRLAVWTGTPG